MVLLREGLPWDRLGTAQAGQPRLRSLWKGQQRTWGCAAPRKFAGGAAILSFMPGAVQRKAKLLCQNCGFHFCGFCILGKQIHNHTGVIPCSGPLVDEADLDRHIVDCCAWANEGGNKWLQALEKYVPAMVGLYPTPRLTHSLRAQAAMIMEGIRTGPPFVEVEGVQRWEIPTTAPPVFVFQKRTVLFRETMELKCGAVSAAGVACKGVVAKFKVGFERLLPTSSVLRCGKCKLYVCLHELMDPGCVSPTRMGGWGKNAQAR